MGSEQLFSPKNENNTPPRETTRGRPRPPPAESGEASNVRYDEITAHRLEDPISS